jgi:MFS family permease
VEMVGAEDLMNAIALNSSMFNSARMVGPAVAGVLVAALGEGMCFLLNGITYLAVIAGLLLMKVQNPIKPARSGRQLDQFVEGVRYVYENRAIRSLLSLLTLVSLVGMPYAVLMPVFAQDVLGRGAAGLGALMTAAGCGALIGALWLARRGDVLGLDRVVVWACAGFGLGLILFAASRSYVLSLIALLPAGYFVMVQMGSTNSLIQSIVDDSMRGRVMGLYATMFLGTAPFGSLAAGFVADHAGAPAAVMAGGVACVFGAALVGFRIKDLNIDLQVASTRAGRTVRGAVSNPRL